MKLNREIRDADVAAVFRAYPPSIRAKLLELRRLIFEVASETDGVGELQETLRWGQPSYLTAETGSGSLIRIDQIKSPPGAYAMYFHCQTTLVGSFREMFRDDFRFVGNRSIVFRAHDRIPLRKLRQCVAFSLTYHLDKKPTRKRLATGTRTGGSATRTAASRRRF